MLDTLSPTEAKRFALTLQILRTGQHLETEQDTETMVDETCSSVSESAVRGPGAATEDPERPVQDPALASHSSTACVLGAARNALASSRQTCDIMARPIAFFRIPT